MKDTVNVKIKFRDPFRPFAPSLIESNTEKFLDVAAPQEHCPNRFMLYVVPVRDEFHEALPAITQCDGSARIQTVRPDVPPLYHQLIETFGQLTGIPVVMNLFQSAQRTHCDHACQRLPTFNNSGLDFLVLGHCLISKAC
jgi:carbamoyltransferase